MIDDPRVAALLARTRPDSVGMDGASSDRKTLSPMIQRSGIVAVRNDSGTARSRFDVMSIIAPTILPSIDEDAFVNQHLTLAVDEPQSEWDKPGFVVLDQDLADGEIGMAYAHGICRVQITVPHENHPWGYCGVIAGDYAKLEARIDGSSPILWREGGTGVQWAIIRFGRQPLPQLRFGKPTATYSGGENITLDPCEADGSDNGQSNVTCPAGWTLPPGTNIPTTMIVPFHEGAPGSGQFYVVGEPFEVVTSARHGAGDSVEVKKRLDFGWFCSTESGWL